MKKATQEQSRLANRRLVLSNIYGSKGISRADIARHTGLARPTVSTIVGELLDQGLVRKSGLGRSKGGKRPRLLTIAPKAFRILTVDLNHQVFRGSVFGADGRLNTRLELRSQGRSGQDALRLAARLIELLAHSGEEPVLGVGIGTPGLVNQSTGVVMQAVNLGWRDIPLGRAIEEQFGWPVWVANDSRMAAMGEFHYFQAGADDNLVLVRVEHGIGAGIILNGSLYSGDCFGAGEIGHTVVPGATQLCSCGNEGCLEAVAGRQAILDEASRLAQEGRSPFLAGRTDLIWEDLLDAFLAGDPAIGKVVCLAGQRLGEVLAFLVAALNVRNIVIGGSVVALGDLYLEEVIKSTQRYVLPALADGCSITYSRHGADTVLFGCAAMVLEQELGVL